MIDCPKQINTEIDKNDLTNKKNNNSCNKISKLCFNNKKRGIYDKENDFFNSGNRLTGVPDVYIDI